MALNQIKSLARMGGRRLSTWKDERYRSPKALGDMSGLVLPKVTSRNQAGLQDFDYDLLSKIYICNDLAWTCIDLVSSTAALAKLKVRKRKGTQVEYLPDHPLQQMLDFPNNSMTQFDLIQAYVTHQLLFGTVTFVLLRQNMVRSCPMCLEEGNEECFHKLWVDTKSPIMQIMPVHPSNIDELYSEALGRKVLVYIPDGYTDRKYPIHPDNVLTDPYYNPDVSWYGVSPTFLLKRWLDLDQAMTGQISSFFANNAIPSMIVSLKPGTNYVHEDEPSTLVEKMKQGWMNQFSASGKTQKAPAFVYGDIKVERIQEKLNDTIGKEIYYEIQGRVCSTYGVPPTLYEIGMRYSGQRASAEQHERDFYNRTISKILARFESKITQLVVPSYQEPGLEIVWDLSDLGIASFLIDTKQKKIERHWEKGLIKRDDARILLGYEPTGDEFGDDYYRITVMNDGQGTQTTNQLDNNLRVPVGEQNTPELTE